MIATNFGMVTHEELAELQQQSLARSNTPGGGGGSKPGTADAGSRSFKVRACLC